MRIDVTEERTDSLLPLREAVDESSPPTPALPGQNPRGPVSKVGLSVKADLVAAEESRLRAIERSAEQLLMQVLRAKDERAVGQPRSDVWNLREVVWPALGLPEFREIELQEVKLTLLPLNRFGQMEGKSGSLVLIGYFSADRMGDLHSHPLVVKTRDRSKPSPGRLKEESDNADALKPFAYDSKDSFAIPIFYDDKQDGFLVLWSICSLRSSIWPPGPADPGERFKIEDLRSPLKEARDEEVRRTLDDVFDLLRNCHCRFGRAGREERLVGKEYEWYLRNFDSVKSPETIWGPEWVDLWGGKDVKFIGGGDSGQVNPVWLLHQLQALKFPMYLGAIHGDLHPGNVVYTRSGQPALIDFGWAQEKAHIAKDFVLMECNLRFLTVRPQVGDEELERFVTWIGRDEALPGGTGEYLMGRGKLVAALRAKAGQVLPQDTDWDREYLVPLFLVAFGLLRFAPQLGNQRAAVRFVLALAQHIARALRL